MDRRTVLLPLTLLLTLRLEIIGAEMGMYSGVLSGETASPYEESYAGFVNNNETPDPNTFFRVNFDTNKCKPNSSFVWCLPKDYNLEKHPFSCKYFSTFNSNLLNYPILSYSRLLP